MNEILFSDAQIWIWKSFRELVVNISFAYISHAWAQRLLNVLSTRERFTLWISQSVLQYLYICTYKKGPTVQNQRKIKFIFCFKSEGELTRESLDLTVFTCEHEALFVLTHSLSEWSAIYDEVTLSKKYILTIFGELQRSWNCNI